MDGMSDVRKREKKMQPGKMGDKGDRHVLYIDCGSDFMTYTSVEIH